MKGQFKSIDKIPVNSISSHRVPKSHEISMVVPKKKPKNADSLAQLYRLLWSSITRTNELVRS